MSSLSPAFASKVYLTKSCTVHRFFFRLGLLLLFSVLADLTAVEFLVYSDPNNIAFSSFF